jgi:hypothetical protein
MRLRIFGEKRELLVLGKDWDSKVGFSRPSGLSVVKMLDIIPGKRPVGVAVWSRVNAPA